MSYINVRIERAYEVTNAKSDALERAESKFWQECATELRGRLENVFRAVKEHGYVEITFDGETVTLVEKPRAEPRPPEGE